MSARLRPARSATWKSFGLARSIEIAGKFAVSGPSPRPAGPWQGEQSDAKRRAPSAGDATCVVPRAGALSKALNGSGKMSAQALLASMKANAQAGSRLGCPGGPAQPINVTVQNFEGGSLLWIPSPDSIIAVRNDGWWSSHANEWRGGEDHFSCDEARAQGRPIMGFGRLWCNDGGVRGALRNPTSDEIWFPDSQVQYFDGGRVFALNNAEAIVLFNDGSQMRVW